MEGSEYNNRPFTGRFQFQINDVALKWAQVDVEWCWAVLKLDGCFECPHRNTGDAITNILMAKTLIACTLLHIPGSEMNFASFGSNNNLWYVMKRRINHYGLF